VTSSDQGFHSYHTCTYHNTLVTWRYIFDNFCCHICIHIPVHVACHICILTHVACEFETLFIYSFWIVIIIIVKWSATNCRSKKVRAVKFGKFKCQPHPNTVLQCNIFKTYIFCIWIQRLFVSMLLLFCICAIKRLYIQLPLHDLGNS